MSIDRNLLAILLPAAAAFAGDLLPLQSGNEWTYRDFLTGQAFTVRVGAPLAAGGLIYHRLNGYVDQRLWIRSREDGTLLYLDEETGAEHILTLFEDAHGGWAAAPLRPCEQESRQAGPPAPHQGMAGWFPAAQRLEYRSSGCADTGVESEVFVSGIGMVQRTVSTIAGPRVYELVSARVGRFFFEAAPATMFSASLVERPGGGLAVALRLAPGAGEPVELFYSDSQEYDFVLWDEAGRSLYRWSDGKSFAQATRLRIVSVELRHEAPLELLDPLPDGRYVVEAWLTTGPKRRGYAAMTPFRIEDGRLVR